MILYINLKVSTQQGYARENTQLSVSQKDEKVEVSLSLLH